MASIYSENGNALSEGLQGCNVCDEAIIAAERMADELGDDVHLVDDDGEWIVHPAVGGVREPADHAADDESSREYDVERARIVRAMGE